MAAIDATAPRRTANTINGPLETNSMSLDEAQELVHIGSWQWSVASGDIVWSDELYRIYGLKPQKQALGFEAFIQLIHPDDREKVTNIINQAYQTKRRFEFEHRIVLPNKRLPHLQGKGKVVTDKAGSVTRMFGTSQDITERKKSDQALHRSDVRFRAISTATSDLVYDVDLQNNTMWLNDAINTEYKYPRRRVRRYTPQWQLEHVHASDREQVRASMDDALKNGCTTWIGEYRFKKNGGSYVDVRDRASIVHDADGSPIRVIGSMLDITQQKELERAKDRFISLVSHQLRTPLTSMRLLAEMLSNGHADQLTPSQQDYIQKIESSAARMTQLVNEILSVSSIETGHFAVRLATADVNAIIMVQIADLSPIAAEKGVAITFTPDESIDTVRVDPMLFSQIVHNLVANAIHYTAKKNGKVHITLQKTLDEYLLAVTDSGIGIPKDAQPHIFSSFYRANNAIKTQSDGSGLGLYLAKLILDMTGGKIWFDSQENHGSTFYVSLPLSGMKNNPNRNATQ